MTSCQLAQSPSHQAYDLWGRPSAADTSGPPGLPGGRGKPGLFCLGAKVTPESGVRAGLSPTAVWLEGGAGGEGSGAEAQGLVAGGVEAVYTGSAIPAPSHWAQGHLGTLSPRAVYSKALDARLAPHAHPCPSRGLGQRHGAHQQPADHTRAGHCLRAPSPGPLPPSVQARRPWPAVDRADEKVGEGPDSPGCGLTTAGQSLQTLGASVPTGVQCPLACEQGLSPHPDLPQGRWLRPEVARERAPCHRDGQVTRRPVCPHPVCRPQKHPFHNGETEAA